MTKCPSHCKDSQKTSLKLYLIVTLFVNFKHNFHKENKTFSQKKLKRFKEKSLKMEPFLSELPYHIYDWLIINLKDFCIVIRKWPTFLPSIKMPRLALMWQQSGTLLLCSCHGIAGFIVDELQI